MALGSALRSAMCSGSCLGSASFPDGQSSCTIRIPLQYEPNAIHGVPDSSSITPGSMALKSSDGSELKTSPRSTHSYCGSDGSSVLFVASPMTDLLCPQVDPA